MKIDYLTGEVLEENEKAKEDLSIVKKEMNEMITDEFLDQLVQYEYLKEQIEIWKFKNKLAIKELFKTYGIKSFKSDYVELTYIAPTTRQDVDRKKLEEAGLLKEFSKDINVSESLRIKIKK